MRWLADLVYLLAGLLYLPVAVYNAVILRKNRRGWRQRFGGVPRFEPGRRRVWIHAVSLGEVNATPRLVAELAARAPDLDIVISTTTDTGFERAVKLYGADRVFRFPLDFSAVVRRALDRIRPTMIVLVELEVWYNLVAEADRRGIPVVVVNGRLTRRSADRLARLGALARPMFQRLAWVGAQDEAIAARFERLGVPRARIDVTSSMKWDTADVADTVAGADELAAACALGDGVPLWVCGSTGPGEEAILLDAYRLLVEGGVSARLVLVPRKPERFDEVHRLIRERGYDCTRRSQTVAGARAATAAPPAASRVAGPAVVGTRQSRAVILGDTMGELRRFYSLADVVLVGRSLPPMGGSDPIEVAALGKPMIAGPHMENFREPVDALTAADAVVFASDAAEIARQVARLLQDPDGARAMGARARAVVVCHQGATRKTVARLATLLNANSAPPGPAPEQAVAPAAGIEPAKSNLVNSTSSPVRPGR